MRKARYAGLAVKVALFYCSAAGVCQSLHAQSETRFRLLNSTIVIVSLAANGQGPFDFVLDTGTDTTIIDPTLAQQLSLAAIDRIQINTLAGSQMLTRSSVGTLAMGTSRAENVEVLVQDVPELHALDSHIRGIAGQNFLSHFNYLLDYRKRSLRLEIASEVEHALEGDRVPLEVRDNKMIVSSDVQGRETVRLRLLLDSASNSVILIRKADRVGSPFQAASVTTAGAEQAGMQMAPVRSLTVGSQQFRDLPVGISRDTPEDAARVEDGLLPTALFQSVYINNRNGFVVFNPRMKKN